MKKKTTRILAMLLVAMMVLSACGGGNNNENPSSGNNSNNNSSNNSSQTTDNNTSTPPTPSNGGEPIKDLVCWETTGSRELEEFFLLHSEKAADHNVLCNAYSPLLEVDNYGKLNPAVAKTWGTEDGGKTWHFELRDDVVWVDINGNEKAQCTAQDWVTAMEWILNYEKNDANNTSMLTTLVEGAKDYYDYTKALAESTPGAAKALTTDNPEFAKVGVKAPDDYSLVYTCISNCTYFDTLCTNASMYPISQAEIDEKGVDNMVGMNNNTMWYNGPYTITEYIMNNEKILAKNPHYWDKDASLFDTVTIIMIDDGNKDDQLYQTGEVDYTELNEATLKTIRDNPSDPYNEQLVETRVKKYSYQMQLNFAKNNEDGTPDTNWNTAVANEAFRKALYYGIDLTTTWARANPVNPLSLENLCFTMKGLLYYSDGTEYTQSVIDQLENIAPAGNDAPRRFNESLALQYKDQAMKELEGKVTFPVEIDYYIQSGGGTSLDAATVLKENFERTLGTDFINFHICEYVSSLTQEVINPKLQSFAGSGWGADYGDVGNFLGQIIYGFDSAYYAKKYTNINELTDPDTIALFQEFTRLEQEAENTFDNLDDRYAKFAEAEAFLLNHALSIPYNYENAWQLTHINDYSKMNALYGSQNYTYKNWETSTEPYTAEDYARFIEEYNANS